MRTPVPAGKIWDEKWHGIDVLQFKDDAFIHDRWTRFHISLVEKYLNRLKEGSLFLEAGCGMGQWCFYSAKKYKVRVIGVDIARENIENLKRISFQQGYGKIDFMVDDLAFSLLESNLCDMFISLGVIEHSRDNALIIKNLYRVLKPDGIGIITVPNVYALHTLTRPVLQLLNRWNIGYECSFSLRNLRRLVTGSGFKIIESGILPTGELFGTFLNNIPIFGKLIRRIGLSIETKQNIFGFLAFAVLKKNGLLNE
jgi:SAM-dependent methyltransferase